MSSAAVRQNARGRFIVFSLIGGIGRSRTLIFPEGSKADGWFALTKLLKESLISGKSEAPDKQWTRPVVRKSRGGRSLSYAEAVRGKVSVSQSLPLRGWRCKQCGSWDVFSAVLGEEKESELSGSKQRRGAQCVQPRGRESSRGGESD